MQIQLNTDTHITGDARTLEVVEDMLQSEIGHLGHRLSRIEVHLADENGGKGGADDIRCTLEARPEGLQPHTVVHRDADVKSALRNGAKKLRAHLESEFGRLDKRR
ncbi:HPF/RaiA family ribosome-associated protein [Roseovarius amoyensis]|uniref:HPF/RaiA family ribosome-associated protein n=1 Tax=Roseovarius amoyensis TaxID=2211448 RepID=UPI000DBEA370|nr:HPF/RaiA family ribosome-associated protein [Roseovarius amoyensis]